MDAKPSAVEADVQELSEELGDVAADIERLELLDPAEAGDLARQISDHLAQALDSTDGPTA